MDWARDHLGNDVPAWQGGMSGFGLRCPSCGEPVRRRAGGERRPHFAHYSHGAKPDCDNYFPSQGSSLTVRLGTAFQVQPPSKWKRESLSCGLFLAIEPGRTSPALWLRIPPINLDATAAGRLEIQSGIGHRAYQLADLSTARLLPLAPQFPVATVVGSGDLLPIAAELAGQTGAFAADRNLFYADEKGGRFIFRDELLEWGARYRLLSLNEIVPPFELGSVLSWKPEAKFGGWRSYEMLLPSAFVGSKPNLHKEVAEFLGHRVRSARPRLHLVDPLPHHVEVGGTYVYPSLPASLRLRRTGPGKASVRSSNGLAEANIREHGDEWVQVSGLRTDGREYVIAIDGNEQVVLRAEPCVLFRPGGVTAGADDIFWDLCADAPLVANALIASAVSVDCSSARIAAHLARLNTGWILEETRLALPVGVVKHFYAGSFGELRGIGPASATEPEEASAEKRAPQRMPKPAAGRWIEQLVVRDYGVEGVSHLRRYLSDPSTENLYRLGPIMTSRLMPYIRAAQHQ